MAAAEFTINRNLSPEELLAIVSDMLDVKPARIKVTGATEPDRWADTEQMEVVCMTWAYVGEFPLRIEFIPLKPDVVDIKDSMDFIKRFARQVNCRIITAEGIDSLDPYEWMLVHEDGTCQKVVLDLDLLDVDENPEVMITQLKEIVDC